MMSHVRIEVDNRYELADRHHSVWDTVCSCRIKRALSERRSLHISPSTTSVHDMASTTFKGYAVTDTKKWSDFQVLEYPAKNWEDTDVEIEISHCGCVHMLRHRSYVLLVTYSPSVRQCLWI